MLSEDHLAWIATELACEINTINCQARMSINSFRESLKHIPGGSDMTMRYGDGGRTQIFMIGENEVEVGPDATPSDIEAALTKKKLQHSAIPLQRLSRS